MNNEQKRTILAFTISGIILFGWNAFFGPKHNEAIEQKVLADNNIVKTVDGNDSKTETAATTTEAQTKTDSSEAQPTLTALSDVELINGDYHFTINSNFSIKEAKGFTTNETLSSFSDKESFAQVYVIDANNNLVPFSLSFEEIAQSSSIVAYDTAKSIKIVFNLSKEGKLSYLVDSKNPIKLAYRMSSSEKQSANNTYREFVINKNDITRIHVGKEKDGDGKTKWFGLDYNHHVFLSVFPKKIVTRFATTESGNFTVSTIDAANTYEGYFLYSLKSYDYLVSFQDQLDQAVNFGLFSILAVPILKGLQFIYSYVGNYGIAIIILTFLIRFLTFPLQFKSFKSMKKMQTVQPEIAKLKERYKDDPARMQKETMELFKRAGANPLGGCLPMILQIPIFIAFYQAINNSVDLVGAPFYGWIFDLSHKDPYYILPVLMGITMLLQTKLNPSTTADPNQQKIMYIMPLVFCFIMKDLPAGLNLYFTISNLLGIGQQLLVYKVID